LEAILRWQITVRSNAPTRAYPFIAAMSSFGKSNKVWWKRWLDSTNSS